MKRSKFFKVLGLGLGAAIVAPKVIADAIEEVKDESLIEKMKPYLESIQTKHIKMQRLMSKEPPQGEGYAPGELLSRGYYEPLELMKEYEITGNLKMS